MQPRSSSLMRSQSVENAAVFLSRIRAPLLKQDRAQVENAHLGGGRRLGAGGSPGLIMVRLVMKKPKRPSA